MKSEAIKPYTELCLPDVVSGVSRIRILKKQNAPDNVFRLHTANPDFPTRHKNPSWLTGIAFHDKNGRQRSISNAAGSSQHSAFFYDFTDIELLWTNGWIVTNE